MTKHEHVVHNGLLWTNFKTCSLYKCKLFLLKFKFSLSVILGT